MGIRKAIISGSVKYIKSPLGYPKKDVEELSNVLKHRCNFMSEDIAQIIHDDSSDDMTFMSKIESCCQEICNNKTDIYDLVVFYYSGHGFFDKIKNTSCLQISDEHHITIDDIIYCITKIKAKNKYIIIDACQSGGFSLIKQPKGKEERKLSYNSEGLYLLFGTTKELFAFEATLRDEIKRNIRNSFFTHFIIEALNKKSLYLDNTISIKVIDDYASKKTAQYTDFDQIPTASTQTSGYFPFGFWNDTDDLVDINKWESDLQANPESMLLSRETGILNSIEEHLMKLYSENNIGYILNSWDKEYLSKLSSPAKDILNRKLDLANKKYCDKPLINGLISTIGTNQDKYYFLQYILDLDDIDINVNLKDCDGLTSLKESLNCKDKYKSSSLIYLLFQRGYIMTSEEETELLGILSANSATPDIITNIAMSIVYKNMKDNEDRSKAYKISRIFLSLISLKYNRVIGYKFPNILALSNNALNSYKEFSTIYLRACKKYNRYDELNTKPSFTKKVEQIQNETPFQDSLYDDIINTMFPELFE